MHAAQLLCFLRFAGAVLSLAAMGCQAPGLVEKSKPVAIDEAVDRLVNPYRLSRETQELLRAEGMTAAYRQQPAEVIRNLREKEEWNVAEMSAVAELISDHADTLVKDSERLSALGWYLTAAQIASPAAMRPSASPDDDALLALYNHACGRAAELLFEIAPEDDPPLSVSGPLGDFTVGFLRQGRGLSDPDYFDELKIAEYLKIKGYDRREVEMGVGGALVGHRAYRPERAVSEPFLPEVGVALPLTATLRFTSMGGEFAIGGPVEISLHDTLIANKTHLNGREVSLASDLTAPLALLTSLRPSRHLGVKSMFRPAEYLNQAGLFAIEPYREDKIPVVLVHGLSKTPAVWIAAINELRADPVIRERFQFLLFRYPSGLPVLYCGAMLREQLQRFREHHDPEGRHLISREVVLMGKSFGGLVSSLQVRHSGDEVRRLFAERPLEQIDIPEKEREALSRLMHFSADPTIRRVVFLVTPHQGTDVADKNLVSLGNRLIQYPMDVITDGEVSNVEGMTELAREYVKRPPTSVMDLRSHSPVVKTIATLPFSERLVLHSIIGKVGDGPLESSNDKMVPYWSSHLAQSVSEVIAPCKHGDTAHHPVAVEEMRRILHLHLSDQGAGGVR